jgi:hypothetical protein
MQMPDGKPVFIYRITHIDNLGFILDNGLYSKSSDKQDPKFISIGNNEIINARSVKDVDVHPGGTLADYVPFYLGNRSPMLYKIQKGYGRSPREIVYLVTTLDAILAHSCQFVFTDGNARAELVHFYSQHQEQILHELDWEAINAKYWNEDYHKQHKKQAEVLVLQHVPMSAIKYIVCYDESTKNLIFKLLHTGNAPHIQLAVRPTYYYEP